MEKEWSMNIKMKVIGRDTTRPETGSPETDPLLPETA